LNTKIFLKVLSEVKKPKKTLKVGGYTAVGLVSVLYICTNLAYFGVVSKAEMLDPDLSNIVAAVFFRKVFGGHISATRVLPGIIALSALGNIIVVTFVACRVKAEIAKEGVLPFSKFFAANQPTIRSRISSQRRPAVPPHATANPAFHSTDEQTPIGALLLHWFFSLIIVLAPPLNYSYDFFVYLYSYTINVWIGAAVSAGLLWLRFQRGSTWVADSSFKPWGGPLMPIVVLIFYAFLIVTPFVPPTGGVMLTMPGITWFVFPVVGTGLLFIGALYWVLFRFVWPNIYSRELIVRRIPILLNGVQIHEIVQTSWVRLRSLDSPVCIFWALADNLQVVPKRKENLTLRDISSGRIPPPVMRTTTTMKLNE
jgi:hypothetical protein